MLTAMNRRFRNFVRAMPPLVDEYLSARVAYPGAGAVRRYRAAEECRLNIVPPDVPRDGLFVDVGANVGDWTAAALDVAPQAHVLALEPGPTAFRTLAARFRNDGRVVAVPFAAGEKAETARFHLTVDDKCSSLLAPRDMSVAYGGPGWEGAGDVIVEVRPLDELVNEDVAVLKLDVQGAETAALGGAQRVLGRTRALIIEVAFESHYVGDATFPGLHETLASLGFDIAGMSKPKVSPLGRLLWLDACYINRNWTERS